jgi:hypothetical protein
MKTLICGTLLVLSIFCVNSHADTFRLLKNGKEVEGKFRANKRIVIFKPNHCMTEPTPTLSPETTPTPTPTPEINQSGGGYEPPPDGNQSGGGYEPFREGFELIWSNPENGDSDVDPSIVINLQFSMSINGQRLSANAFELKSDSEIIEVTHVLYSTRDDGTNARNIRIIPHIELQTGTQYTLKIKSSQSLIAANAAGASLDDDVVIHFTTK